MCGEEQGGRAGTSDFSGLNKASLYPPLRSSHPNYTPDTSALLLLISHPLRLVPISDHASPLLCWEPWRPTQYQAAGGICFAVCRLPCITKRNIDSKSIDERSLLFRPNDNKLHSNLENRSQISTPSLI